VTPFAGINRVAPSGPAENTRFVTKFQPRCSPTGAANDFVSVNAIENIQPNMPVKKKINSIATGFPSAP
jgi:hypothetical protein